MRATHLRASGTLRTAYPLARCDGYDSERFREDVPGDRGGAVRPRLAWMAGFVPSPGNAHPDAWAVPGGRQHASGRWGSDGGALGPIGGSEFARGLCFDRTLRPGGYAWWYVDAMSHNGCHGMTIIAFVGNAFSPYYAWASKREAADPLNYCALNVALYDLGATCGGRRWTMTERRRHDVRRSRVELAIGPSSLVWDGDALSIWIDEYTTPWPSRVRGVVRIYPQFITDRVAVLDGASQHRWWPIAPSTRVQVVLEEPDLRWLGTGYLDSNWGDAPLETAFSRWDWSRARLQVGTAVLYDIQRRQGTPLLLALRFAPSGQVEEFEPPAAASLPRTLWGIERGTRADLPSSASVIKTLEDGPFYARSLVAAQLLGEPIRAVHESVSLDRLRRPSVKLLLPFRMPRR